MCFALTASSIQTSISKFVGDACGKNAGTSQGEITARGYLLLGLVISCTASVIVGIFFTHRQTGSPCIFSESSAALPSFRSLAFPCFPAASTPVLTVITMEKAGRNSLVLSAGGTACTRGKCMADLSVHAGKGMELTAFHAVAGLVAGECSGLITSLIAMSLEKRLPGHSYHTLSGQWKTMGKLFASMAVPLTINRVTTALFNSLENLLIPQNFRHLVTVLRMP